MLLDELENQRIDADLDKDKARKHEIYAQRRGFDKVEDENVEEFEKEFEKTKQLQELRFEISEKNKKEALENEIEVMNSQAC